MDRNDLGKLIVGGCVSILLTAMVFGPMGFGRRYTDRLEQQVRRSLAESDLRQVAVAVEHDPALRRSVVLSGAVPDQVRTSALDISSHVPGVADVRWATADRRSVRAAPSSSAQLQ